MATNAHLDHYYQEELPALLKASLSLDTPATPQGEPLPALITDRLSRVGDLACLEWAEETFLASASSWLRDIVQNT